MSLEVLYRLIHLNLAQFLLRPDLRMQNSVWIWIVRTKRRKGSDIRDFLIGVKGSHFQRMEVAAVTNDSPVSVGTHKQLPLQTIVPA